MYDHKTTQALMHVWFNPLRSSQLSALSTFAKQAYYAPVTGVYKNSFMSHLPALILGKNRVSDYIFQRLLLLINCRNRPISYKKGDFIFWWHVQRIKIQKFCNHQNCCQNVTVTHLPSCFSFQHKFPCCGHNLDLPASCHIRRATWSSHAVVHTGSYGTAGEVPSRAAANIPSFQHPTGRGAEKITRGHKTLRILHCFKVSNNTQLVSELTDSKYLIRHWRHVLIA